MGGYMKKTVLDYKVKGKKVILRCDLNVPIKDGIIMDDTRIKESTKTIKHLVMNGAKVIILSHLGRIKDESDKLSNSLLPVARRLSEILGMAVNFIPYTRGSEVDNAISNMNNGDIVMLENTRFEDLNGNLESNCDIGLSSYWASLGDIFINDAFGTIHRAHASNVGIAKILPSGIGFLVYDEVEKIEGALNNPSRPLVVILGGAKVKDKIGVIENAVKIADYVLIGGGMVYTFLKAMGYNIGLSIVDDESIVFCKKMLSENSSKIILPEDVVVAKSMTNESSTRLVNINGIMENEIGVDIGVLTISKYKTILSKAGTIIWNGPVGVFEIPNFSNGTRKLVQILSSLKAKIVIGGGDSVSALNKFGFSNSNAHISTGGGASLEMLEGKELPGLSAISDL